MPEETAHSGTHYGQTCTLVRLAACFTRKTKSTQNQYGAKYDVKKVKPRI